MKQTSRNGLAVAALVAGLGATGAVAIAHQPAPSVGASPDNVKITENVTQLPFAPSSAERASSPVQSTFVHGGRQISTEEAVRKGLSCVQHDQAGGLCFSSGGELDRYENVPSAAASLRNADRRTRVVQRAAKKQTGSGRQYAQASSHTNCCPLTLWENRNYDGWRIDVLTSGKWFDLPSGYNDNASSYYTGAHTGYIYENYISTAGGWLVSAGPYVHGCLCGRYNDEASSRARAG